MKRSILCILIAGLLLQPLLAENIRPVVEESDFQVRIGGGLDNFRDSVNYLDASYNLYELQFENGSIVGNESRLNFDLLNYSQTLNSKLLLGLYDTNIALDFLSGASSYDFNSKIYVDYTHYFRADTSLPILVGFSSDYSNVRIQSSGSNKVEAWPKLSLGIGRVYSIDNVTRAKLLMDALGVEETNENVKAVAQILDKHSKLITKYKFGSANPASYDYILDYYQEIADAMGISNRRDEVMAVNDIKYIENADYRNSYANVQTGYELKATITSELEYKFEYPNPVDNGFTYSDPVIGANAKGCGYLVENVLFGIFETDYYYTLGSTTNHYAEGKARIVYFPPIATLLLEMAADAKYDIVLNDFTFDASAALHVLFDREVAIYAGAQYYNITNGDYDMGVFVGADIRLL